MRFGQRLRHGLVLLRRLTPFGRAFRRVALLRFSLIELFYVHLVSARLSLIGVGLLGLSFSEFVLVALIPLLFRLLPLVCRLVLLHVDILGRRGVEP
jgi:hypothetical protein